MNVAEKSIENDPLGLKFAGGVTITLTDANSNIVETETFDDDINPGWYQFTGLSAGTYTLIASKPCWSFNPSSQEVTITDADATGTDFTSVKNYYSIYGTVTEQGSGDPVAGASLSLYSLGTYLRSTVSDSGGQYMFNGLENGGYTITLDSGCVPEGMGSMSAFVNCANVEKNFECRGGLGESKRQEASSRRDSVMRVSTIDNKGREADNGDMETTADKGSATAISHQPSARAEASVAEYLFYHCDHLGTVRLITDNSGAVVSRHDYEPFGVEIAPVVKTANNTHQFTGHERDANTGYDYMHYRSYGSNIGRFMKPDNVSGNPLNPQSWNLYSYVRGNPVNFNDPTGHVRVVGLDISDAEAMLLYDEALDCLATKPISAKTMNQMENISGNDEVTVVVMPEVWGCEQYDDKKNIIYWNPYEGRNVEGQNGEPDKEGNYIQSPSLMLLHESEHAVGDATGIMQDTTKGSDENYDTKEEKRVIENIQNPAAKQLNEPTTKTHTADSVEVNGPTSKKVVKKNKGKVAVPTVGENKKEK